MTYFNKGSDGLYLLHMLEATRAREEEEEEEGALR